MSFAGTRSVSPRAVELREQGVGFLTDFGGLFIGTGMMASAHQSHAYKICIATYGEFQLRSADGGHTSCGAIVIPPDHPHEIDARGTIMAIFYLVPEQVAGQMLLRALHGRGIFAPPPALVASLMPSLHRYLTCGASVEEVSETCNYLFNNLTPAACRGRPLDSRVGAVLDYLNQTVDSRVVVPEIASSVGLSASRLEHLFSEVVGLPMTRYLLWHRVRRAVEQMPNHCKLTELAYSVGFADSAHLTRSFRRMLGIQPSKLRHIQLVKG